MDILKIRDPKTGKWVTIPALKTPTDKSYNPESENAQSGLAVAEALNQYMIITINPAIALSVEDYGKNIINPQISSLTAKDKELEAKDTQLGERIDKIISSGLIRKVVEALPDISEAAENVIYMIKNDGSNSDNIYDEYMLTTDKSILGVLEAATVDSNNWYPQPESFPTIYEGKTCTAFVDISENGTQYGLSFGNEPEVIGFSSADSNLIELIGQYATNGTVLYDITANSLTSIDVVQYTATKHFELIGSTAVDLSGYATTEYVDSLVGDINTVLSSIVDVEEE